MTRFETLGQLGRLLYRYDLKQCPACSKSISKTKYIGLYMVGPFTAIAYCLCRECGKESREGLPQAKLARANQSLEAFAARAGLVKKGAGHA